MKVKQRYVISALVITLVIIAGFLLCQDNQPSISTTHKSETMEGKRRPQQSSNQRPKPIDSYSPQLAPKSVNSVEIERLIVIRDRIAQTTRELESLVPIEIKKQTIASRHIDYDELLKSWSIDPETIAEIKKIVYERDIDLSEMRANLSPGNDKPASGVSTIVDIKRRKDQAKMDLSRLIGIARTDELLRWEDARPDRRQLEKFAQKLSSQDIALTNQQEQFLFDVLYNTRMKLTLDGKVPLSLVKDRYDAEVMRQVSSSLSTAQQKEVLAQLTNESYKH